MSPNDTLIIVCVLYRTDQSCSSEPPLLDYQDNPTTSGGPINVQGDVSAPLLAGKTIIRTLLNLGHAL
ncbi:unnamed protein product [Prunus armeniaca]